MQAGSGARDARSKARNWKDVQLIVSSFSMAVTLGLWSLWASREKAVAAVEVEPTAPAKPTAAFTEPMLLPGQVLVLAAPTPQAAAAVSAQQKPKRESEAKGGGGKANGGKADAGTGSS